MIARLADTLFAFRRLLLFVFSLLTIFLAYQASQLGVDAGFEKQLPLTHPYMQTFLEHQQEFGGANRILIALRARGGDMFTPEFFVELERLTQAVAALEGVNQGTLRSLFTPNVRFIEIVEGGFSGGNVIPAEFTPTAAGLELVRENILKAGIVGRLVANDFSAAMVSAELVEYDPNTGQRLDYLAVAAALEHEIRDVFQSETLDIHIIGFAKAMGDIADGARSVIIFFGVALLVTFFIVWVYSSSVTLTLLSIACSFVAVIWGLGLLTLLGFGLDPMSILVPFLVFAIAVSHSVQMLGAFKSARLIDNQSAEQAARTAFEKLFQPGIVALISDTVGFMTIALIEIRIIQELAITASLGVGTIILTNLFLLPLLLSFTGGLHLNRSASRSSVMRSLHLILAAFTSPSLARISVFAAVVGAIVLYGVSTGLQVGDAQKGVPELREEARYNQDTDFITSAFSISVDVINTIVETVPDACVAHDAMQLIDEFQWKIQNLPGVQSTLSLPQVAKLVNAGWNEGHLKWRVLPRNPQTLVQSVQTIDTGTGLLNGDCSVMPVMIFLEDHKAETLKRITAAVEDFAEKNDSEFMRFRLATGNAGVAAATNEVVSEAQFRMLVYVYAAVILLCLLSFRSISGTLCVVLPLFVISLVCYAAMSTIGIGLKVSTLPVAALGVGIGVDYGIYIYSRLAEFLRRGKTLREAYLETLKTTGSAVIITGLTLTLGVLTWTMSDLKFQADMGILLAIMFFGNMIGALVLIPALRRLLPGA